MKVESDVGRQEFWAEIERDAKQFSEFQPAYVLSLLRTPAYIKREVQNLPPEGRAAIASRRLERQRALGDQTRTFEFIMTEGALLWQVGNADLMIEQIVHIKRVSSLPNVRVGIIPWYQPVQSFAGHAFHLYDDYAVGVGTAHGVVKSTDPTIVDIYRKSFNELRQIARFDVEALKELERIKNAYEALRHQSERTARANS